MNVIAIIGTAGRVADGRKLTSEIYKQMLSIADNLVQESNPSIVISGGAAWSDHLAVSLFLNGRLSKLRLYLPCKFDKDNKQFEDDGSVDYKTNPGGTSNYYHKLFSEKIGKGSLDEIALAIDTGADVIVGNGMFDRNARLAKEATHIIAFTYGNKEVLKDGGTAYTMQSYLRQRIKFNQPDNSYHVDLNTMTLYKNAKVIV